MVRPVVDDDELKERLGAMVTKVEGECIDVEEIRNKPPEYHSASCPRFKAWRAQVRAAREAAAGKPL